MKSYIIVVAFLLSVSGLQAQDWKEYKYESLEFKAAFPQTPEQSVQKVPTALGDMDMHMTMLVDGAEDDLVVYNVIRTVYPAAQFENASDAYYSEVLDGAVQGAVGSVPEGAVVYDKEVTFNGFPARNFKMSYNDGFIYMNAVLVNNVMFIVQVVCTTKGQNNPSIQRFLDSFELIKTKK